MRHHAFVPGGRRLRVMWREVRGAAYFEAVFLQRLDVLAQREPVKSRPEVLFVKGDADLRIQGPIPYRGSLEHDARIGRPA